MKYKSANLSLGIVISYYDSGTQMRDMCLLLVIIHANGFGFKG